jgi:hypothetical protein
LSDLRYDIFTVQSYDYFGAFIAVIVAGLFGITAWALIRGKGPKKPPGDPEWIPTELIRRGRKRKRQNRE